jgi:hypothetical protein
MLKNIGIAKTTYPIPRLSENEWYNHVRFSSMYTKK